ncbi:hypothetical protein BBJ28_00003703 [Nothophytophthora sp. Chile5]|nr:hypothetical protein BBJ28_00003703 [Nothophytophthora sp. Chile5]
MQQTTVAPQPLVTSLAAEQYPLLTAARVVSRYCLPEGELPHVTRLVDAFLDELSSKWTLVQSSKRTGRRRLMQYIAARQAATTMDPLYRHWVFNAATWFVTSRGDLPALQWLAESYLPNAFMTAAVYAAATTGCLHILEWLFARHRGRSYWGCIELCGALENHQSEVVEWLHTHAGPRPECLKMVLRSAAKAGNLAVVHWICNEYHVDAGDAFFHAQRGCQWETAQWLLANCEVTSRRVNWDAAAADGALTYLQFAHSRSPRTMLRLSTSVAAASNGHLEVLQWLYSDVGVTLTRGAMRHAAENGHLNVVQWLHNNGCERGDAWMLDGAAKHGHFEIVRLLHANREEGCTWRAMSLAAGRGHLEIVQWLHAHRTEGCTVVAMDLAAQNNHMDVVQWLHEHRSEGCTTNAMDGAAREGHLEMVQWLHAHRREGCTTAAMNSASRGGHLDVIKWLHANRREGCTTSAMDWAASLGRMEVVKWLHENRREGCTAEAMNRAAIKGHLEVAKWLHENRWEGCSVNTMADAAANGHLEVVKWLHNNRSEVDAQLAMTKAIQRARFEVVLYLHAEGLEAAAFDDNTVFKHPCWELTQWLIENHAERVNGCAFEVLTWDWRFNEWCRQSNLQPARRTEDFTLWVCDSAVLRVGAQRL